MDNSEERFLTTDEVAVILRTVPGTLRYWRYMGKGPRSFRAGKKVLYDRADLAAWIEQSKGGE